MFDFVRNHTRLVLGFLLLLIVPSFVFFGVQGYSRFTEAGNETVAKVDGVAITRAEWDAAHARNVERVRRQSPDIDVQLLDSPQVRRETLDGMVRERVLLAAARQMQLFPSVARMAMLFDSDPQFAGLRGPDGRINRDLLAAQGLTPEMFDQRLRQDFAMQQVLAGITQTPLAPATIAAAAIDPLFQRREVQLQRYDPAAYRARVALTDAEIEAYYKANEARFQAPEQAVIEYVVLDIEPLARSVTVPEEDLRTYYAENASRYTVAEERRASHILITAGSDMASAERQKARERAEALLAEVRKSPASFAEVARKNSQDPGSAELGGDLGFFSRGAMVKAFEDAVYAMKSGEISNLVESDFGYHIITLTGQRGGQKKAFEEVRAEIEAEVRKSLAQRRWAEVAEQFTNTVYEQSDSLQAVVDRLKLEKKTATVQRTSAPGATGALASTKLLQAVFAADSLRNKRNTDAIDVGANQLASARIVEYTPARTRPLAEVQEAVRARLLDEQSAALARKEGQARLDALRQAPAEALPNALTISRSQTQGLPAPVVDAVLRADASKLPAVAGVDLGAQGYVVLRVT
ncbi:MAG: SurA N-terminal domain-containing protein, partial [Rubrivivax sp.]|nr:SurA N-terminal domain-containing protein [Rubrivivax sp.]